MYRVPNDVRSSHQPEGAVVLDIRHGRMFGLNSVGSKILQLLDAETDEPAIVSQISREFGVGHEVARLDVREFIATLMQHGLVEALQDPEQTVSRSQSQAFHGDGA